MSRAFDRFLKELDANGPEKKDGFDAPNLAKLQGHERADARRLLVEAMRSGDSTAVDGLLALDGDSALPALKENLGQTESEDTRVCIAAALLDAGYDAAAERTVIDALGARYSHTRMQATMAMQKLPPSSARAALLEAQLSADPDNRLFTARALLHACAIAPPTGDVTAFRDLWHHLASADDAVRAEALLELRGNA